jgi:hypothetical protein
VEALPCPPNGQPATNVYKGFRAARRRNRRSTRRLGARLPGPGLHAGSARNRRLTCGYGGRDPAGCGPVRPLLAWFGPHPAQLPRASTAALPDGIHGCRGAARFGATAHADRGAVIGSLIGIAFAGPLGAAGGALIGAAVTPVMERWLDACADEFRRRRDVVVRGASAASGLAEDEVVERLLESVVSQPLVARVLDAAARTDSFEILRLLGGVLGESVRDRPRKIDADLMLVDGITGLTTGHLRVLEVMEGQANPDNPDVAWGPNGVTAQLGGSLSAHGVHAAVGGLVGTGADPECVRSIRRCWQWLLLAHRLRQVTAGSRPPSGSADLAVLTCAPSRAFGCPEVAERYIGWRRAIVGREAGWMAYANTEPLSPLRVARAEVPPFDVAQIVMQAGKPDTYSVHLILNRAPSEIEAELIRLKWQEIGRHKGLKSVNNPTLEGDTLVFERTEVYPIEIEGKAITAMLAEVSERAAELSATAEHYRRTISRGLGPDVWASG